MSFGADTTAATLHVTGTDLIPDPVIDTQYSPPEYDEEGTEIQPEQLGTVTFPAVSGTNYTFSTVETALEFARNPQVYIQNHTEYVTNMQDSNGYPFDDTSYYTMQYDTSLQATMSEVTVSIETGGVLDYEVDLSQYSMITTITFTATPAILTLGSGQRHFITAAQTRQMTVSVGLG